jgi:hypothetical protein
VTLFVCAVALESLTVKVTGVAAIAVVGMPEIAPLAASVSPAGSAPELTAQDSGAVPPVAANVAE